MTLWLTKVYCKYSGYKALDKYRRKRRHEADKDGPYEEQGDRETSRNPGKLVLNLTPKAANAGWLDQPLLVYGKLRVSHPSEHARFGPSRPVVPASLRFGMGCY
jgi:hypothetical protein